MMRSSRKEAVFLFNESVIEVAINILGFFINTLEILTLCRISYLDLAENVCFNLFDELSCPSSTLSLFHTLVFINALIISPSVCSLNGSTFSRTLPLNENGSLLNIRIYSIKTTLIQSYTSSQCSLQIDWIF